MCGILAIVDLKGRPVRESTARRLRDTMYHRGPDDGGLFVSGPVALGHRRLSIIDLSTAGHQPMTNEDGSLKVVFNGEIYNYVELGNDLRARGHVFGSSTDTEMILHQYEEDGDRCVEKFRGMFAFALWDSRRRRLVAARDKFGIKPLYYYRDENQLILASEIKAIVEDEHVARRPNMVALADYLFAGRGLRGKTLFENIHEVEPGHTLTLDATTGRLEVKRYWDVRYDYNYSRPLEKTYDEMFALLDDAVGVQCRSDAPLGSHLSDGVDSSSVVAFASRHRQRLKTFSIKFSGEAHVDSGRFTKTVAQAVGAEFHETSPTAGDLADLLPYLIWHMDAPMISDGGFGYLTVSEFARQHVKVCLTGHGGDEVFAGYPAQFRASFNRTDMFELFADPERVRPKAGLVQRLLQKGPRGVWNALRKRAASDTLSFEDLWIALHCGPEPRDSDLVQDAWVSSLNGYSPRTDYLAPFAAVRDAQTLDRCLYHDLRVYLPSLLHKEDRVSMSVSIESRVPLLDDLVVEFLATVPPEQKVHGLQPKHLLRRSGGRLLPREIMENRAKRGFPVPGSFWKAPSVTDTVRRILLSKESLERGIFKPQALRDACESVTLFFPLVNIELWFKLFIDRDPYWLAKAKDARTQCA